ncbi:MAG: OsmC family peroxiredoxin [Dermatophilaceae bacterium]
MSIADRSAQFTWQGPLNTGYGKLAATSSGALDGLDLTWASRTEQPGGKSSPEELAAAAHASCFSMALAMALGQQATPPQRLQVEAKVTLAEVDGQPTITTSHLQVRGQVPGIDADKFSAIVDEAATSCPVSRLFAGADITVEAQLDETA